MKDLRFEKLFIENGVKNIRLIADPVTGEPFWSAMGFQNSGEKSPENNLNIYEKYVKRGVNNVKTGNCCSL